MTSGLSVVVLVDVEEEVEVDVAVDVVVDVVDVDEVDVVVEVDCVEVDAVDVVELEAVDDVVDVDVAVEVVVVVAVDRVDDDDVEVVVREDVEVVVREDVEVVVLESVDEVDVDDVLVVAVDCDVLVLVDVEVTLAVEVDEVVADDEVVVEEVASVNTSPQHFTVEIGCLVGQLHSGCTPCVFSAARVLAADQNPPRLGHGSLVQVRFCLLKYFLPQPFVCRSCFSSPAVQSRAPKTRQKEAAWARSKCCVHWGCHRWNLLMTQKEPAPWTNAGSSTSLEISLRVWRRSPPR